MTELRFDDFKSFSDYKVAIAYVLSRLCATSTDDRGHNLHVLNQLIKSACPPEVLAYWLEGYVDPVPRIVTRAVVKAAKKRAKDT